MTPNGMTQAGVQRVNQYPKGGLLKRLFRIELRAEAVVNLDDVIGAVDPRIYGQAVLDLKDYGWLGTEQDADLEALFQALHPPICRFAVGKFENVADRAAVDAYLKGCEQVGAQAFLSFDIDTLSAEDAANWVKHYDGAGSQKGQLWGLRIEAGDLSALDCIRKIQPIITAMRAVNSEIQLAIAGKAILPGDPQDAEGWTRTMLAGVGDQIDYLALSLSYPDKLGLQDPTDPEQWHHSLLSAPHGVEEMIQRMGEVIRDAVPGHKIGLVLDGFSINSLAGEGGTLQDALFVAGMLNVFQRQCDWVKVACLAQGADWPQLIVKPKGKSTFPTPLYFPYLLYHWMEPELLSLAYWSPVFQAQALGGNIRERNQVPFIDITATRSPDGRRVVLGITNRSPLRQAKVMVNLKGAGNRKFRVVEAQLLSGPDALASNTADAPKRVSVRPIKAPRLRFAWLDLALPPASLMVVVLEKKR